MAVVINCSFDKSKTTLFNRALDNRVSTGNARPSPLALLRAGLSVLVFILWSGSSWASTQIEACLTCYSAASFRNAAEQYSLNNKPGLIGVDEVYVFNPFSADVRFFHVNRWIDTDFDPLGQLPKDRSSRLSNDRKASTQNPLNWGFFRAEATEMPGDGQVLSQLLDAIALAALLNEFIAQGVSSEDLPGFSDLGIGSAVELLGPWDSPAGFRRGALQNALNAYLQNWMSDANLVFTEMAHRVLNRLGAPSGTIRYISAFRIEFPDGTSILVEVESILESATGGDTEYVLRVVETSVEGPGLTFVPQTPNQFGGFTYADHDTTARELGNLARRHGIPVFEQGAYAGACDFSCEMVDGVLACSLRCQRP